MTERRQRSLAITGVKFEPYALAIGQMALAWNELHEALGILFTKTLASGIESSLLGIAIWGAVTNDRQKRLILGAAINHIGEEAHLQFPQLASDVLWIIDRTHSLEDKRNNVVHSPLAEVTSELIAVMAGLQMGDVFPGGVLNERALKLSKSTIHVGKNLLTEMNIYRDYAEMLASFSDDIFTAWLTPAGTWPEKPVLPPLKDKA
ncbi:MAG TPA: hypothetical protein VFC38_11990 [Stellaceae bacterium]|nr:hypothetical protein [Stellaceae bacterium]